MLSFGIIITGFSSSFKVYGADIAVGAVAGATAGSVITVGKCVAGAAIGKGLLAAAEHHKKGTTNPSNQSKREKGQSRKQRDQGGEKGDVRRRPNPNKRH